MRTCRTRPSWTSAVPMPPRSPRPSTRKPTSTRSSCWATGRPSATPSTTCCAPRSRSSSDRTTCWCSTTSGTASAQISACRRSWRTTPPWPTVRRDGFELGQLARDLSTWTKAGSTLVVTDVVHRNQLDGIYFFGPAADAWPSLPAGWMVLSATQANKPGKDGAFGSRFAKAMGGKADIDGDRFVTAAELFSYLVKGHVRVRADPARHRRLRRRHGAGRGRRAAARRVSSAGRCHRARRQHGHRRGEAPRAPAGAGGRVPRLLGARGEQFVWAGGSGQTVQCREEPVAACAPSCYVREFKAGPCQLSAIFDGVEMQGEVVVLGRASTTARARAASWSARGRRAATHRARRFQSLSHRAPNAPPASSAPSSCSRPTSRSTSSRSAESAGGARWEARVVAVFSTGAGSSTSPNVSWFTVTRLTAGWARV